ncbi:MAG: hypothetical protein HQ519_11890 [Planctomycetes bacterium]|nr:hypothetical protein [Planctomycetota bacterium]
MIPRSLRFSGYIFALTTVVAALVDSGAMALGGSDAHYALVGGLVVLALGIGLMRPGPCGHLHLLSASSVGLAAWILPSCPRWLAIPILLGMTLPLTIVARRLGQVLTPTSCAGRRTMLVAFCLGLMLVNFGTGPWLFLLMLIGILLPPPVGSADPATDFEPPTNLQQVSVVMVALLGAAMMIALHPYLTLFDDGSVLQDTRRAVSLVGVFAFGWWLLGTSIGDYKLLRFPGAALLCGVVAFAISTSAVSVGKLSEAKVFAGLISWGPLLKLLGRTEPLTENHWVWVPLFTLALGALPMFAWAAAMRATLGARKQGVPTSMALGLALIGFGLGYLLLGGMDHRFAGQASLNTAFSIALVAALACASAANLRLGIPALIIAIGIPFMQSGAPTVPTTGHPFRDWFEYRIAINNSEQSGQKTGRGSVARVLDRGGAASVFGTFFLADGRNVITPTPEMDRLWSAEVLFPLVLKGKADRVLMVGTPHGPSMRALKNVSSQSVHWAVDPPELAEVAWGYQPSWLQLELNGLTATAAEADGEFDYIFVRENAMWEQRRARSFRPAALRHAARKLAPGGMLALALDPSRTLPGMVSRIGEALADAVGAETHYWIIPHGVRVPGLILTAQKPDGEGRQDAQSWVEHPGAAKVLEEMDYMGYPMKPGVDLKVLEFKPRVDESKHFNNLLAGPLPNMHLALASTAHFAKEGMLPFHRAGRVLAGLGAEGALPWVMATHENAQIFDLPDNQLVADEKKADFDFATYKGLLKLARLHPDSLLLQRTCEVFAWSAVANREVEWLMDFVPKLVDDLGWRTSTLLWAYASALHEMLDSDGAEKLIEEALEADPNFEFALDLQKVIHGDESQFESRSEHEGHEDH